MMLLALPSVGVAAELRVAVAGRLLEPLTTISSDFSKASGITVALSAGPISDLNTEIMAGNPFDVLVSTNSATPNDLVEKGKAVAGSARTFALGVLVLAAASGGTPPSEAALSNAGVIAIPNPATAPFGVAGVEALKSLGLFDAVSSKLRDFPSAEAAIAAVVSHDADFAFAPKSLVTGDKWLTWELPVGSYSPIEMKAVVLGPGQNNPAAAAFIEHLLADASGLVLVQYGYLRP
jgi:molybdate transport system substrate-binding protein